MRVASYTTTEWLLARLWFLLDKGRPFKEGAIALEALSEATNGDADGVVMNPASQLTKFLEAQPTADSVNEKGGLACAGATRILERQNVLQTSQVLFRRICVSLAMVLPFKDSEGGTWFLNLFDFN
jgi:hypothetical protein